MAPSTEVVLAGSDKIVTIDHDQSLKASTALLSHIKKAAKNSVENPAAKKNVLANDDSDTDDLLADTPIWVTLATKRHIVGKPRLHPSKISPPHPLRLPTDDDLSVCLITADPQRAYKDAVAHDDFPADLRRRIGRVVDLTKLKAKHSQYEAQRKLYAEHDVFLADERIINRLPAILGKTFYRNTTKRPVPVVLAPKKTGPKAPKGKRPRRRTDDEPVVANAAAPAKIAREVQRALGAAIVSLGPSTNTALRVGFASWTPEQIADNVDAVASALVEKYVPQKWRNVKAIHIKGPATVALPIWLTDELWVDDKDVVADSVAVADTEEIDGDGAGKKRKAVGEEPVDSSPAIKKTKKAESTTAAKDKPISDDAALDKQISERKARLRSSKAKASKALD